VVAGLAAGRGGALGAVRVTLGLGVAGWLTVGRLAGVVLVVGRDVDGETLVVAGRVVVEVEVLEVVGR